MTKDDKKIKLTNPKDDYWGDFAMESIQLDKDNAKPNGYHWFLGLYHINNHLNIFPKTDFIDIKNTAPKTHWLKKLDIATAVMASKHPANVLAAYIKKSKQKNITCIYFFEMHFEESINFSNFIFPVSVSFEHTKFSGNVSFENAIFKEYINFKDSKFQRRASFQRATFETHAPRFYGAELNKEVTWDNITWPAFPNVRWALWQDILRFIESDSADMQYVENVRENQNSYEDLANHMEDLNKYHDQHLFFRREMGCRRRLENYFIRLFYWLYEKFSNYGYGIGHAFIFWFLHIFFGTIAIFITVFCIDMTIKEIIFCSISTSFANANPFVFIGIKDGSLMACYTKLQIFSPVGIGYIRIIQTIIGIPLLFLLLTTLRVRFRLK